MKHHLFSVAMLTTLALTTPQVVQAQRDASPTAVIAAEVKSELFADKVEALGTLRARESVELTSSVTEIVTKVYFDDNQRVKKGDILLEMDAVEEQAELAEQRSFTEESQRQVDRLVPLVKNRAASASVLDENRRELEGAKARMNAIQSRIDQRVIKAPFDGILGFRNISVGSLAQPGQVITTIDDDMIMKLDFSVPEVFLASLKPRLIIEAQTDAYPDRTFKGEIASVNSRINPVTRSIQARALIDNAEGLLRPGLLMTVELQKNPRSALIIPEEALLANGPDSFVFVINTIGEKRQAEKRQVKLGARRYGEVEILDGLQQGDQIVTHGILRISSGDPVTIKALDRGTESLSDMLNSPDPSLSELKKAG